MRRVSYWKHSSRPFYRVEEVKDGYYLRQEGEEDLGRFIPAEIFQKLLKERVLIPAEEAEELLRQEREALASGF